MAESLNIVIRDKLLPALIGGEIPKKYWPVVLEAINYLRNRSPHTALDKTPFEVVYGQRPNVSNIRVLGTEAWYLLPSTKRKKLDERALKCKLLGFEGLHTYLLLLSGST
jgi:hypothetical protein